MSNPQLRIAGGPGGTCCPCPVQVTACTCNANGCSFLCQSNTGTSGIASLCGFNELGIPSIPPKKYRKQELKSVGDPFTRCTLPSDNCTPLTLPCSDGDFYCSFSGPLPGNAGIETFNGGLTLVNKDAVNAYYYATIVVTWCCVGTPPSPVIPYFGRIGTATATGDIVVIPLSAGCFTATAECLGGTSGVYSQVCSQTIKVGGPTTTKVSDKWDISTQYSKDDCGTVTLDNSGRSTGTGVDCSPLIAISGTGFGCDDPAVCYGAGVNPLEVLSTTTGLYNEAGCYITVSPSTVSSGKIGVALSDEDLPADAVARAVAAVGATWTDCPDGQATQLTAFMTVPLAGQFTFGFRSVRVKGHMTTLIIGHTYEITIGWYDRVLSTTGPFLFAGTTVVTLTASSTTQDTPYVDVPNEPGFETKAVTCAVVDITGP